jgi:hypothetical protein
MTVIFVCFLFVLPLLVLKLIFRFKHAKNYIHEISTVVLRMKLRALKRLLQLTHVKLFIVI